MSASLQSTQREIAELEDAHAWLRTLLHTGRREAHLAEQHIAKQLASLKRMVRHELAEDAGYVIWDSVLRRAWANGDWVSDLSRATRTFDAKEADQRLKELRAAQSKRNRSRLSVQPLAKLLRQPPSFRLTPAGD